MIEVELPDGRVVEINTTDPAVAARAAQKFMGSKPEIGVAEDAVKSVGSGLASMTAGTLGMAGDLRSGLSAAADWAGSKMGAAPDRVQAFKDIMSKAASFTPSGKVLANAPTSRQIKDSAPDPIVSPDYQPQTPLGGYLKTGTELASGMAMGGPRSLLARFGTNVAAPAFASETAGQLTKGTEAEPYARVGGALLGGAGATKLANSLTEARALRSATPALADVKKEASSAYDALTSRNVATPISQGVLDSLSDDIITTLNNKGIRPSNAGSIHNAIGEIKAPATAGAADVADLVAARQSIKELLGKPDTNSTGAVLALQKIEKAIEQNSAGTMAKIREADKNWGAAKANKVLDKKLANAELDAAGEHSGFNVGNKIRQNVKSLLKSSEAKYLSAETKAELEKVVRGTVTSNTVRAVSKLFGAGGGLGMLAGGAAGYSEGGLPGAVAAGLAGRSLGKLDATLTAQRAARAAQAIRRGSPLGQQTPLALPQQPNPLLSGLLPALLARPQQ